MIEQEQSEKVLNEKTIFSFYFRGDCIPPRMTPAIMRYFNEKVPPGDFLRAVLENDLMKASLKADAENSIILPVYMSFLYNYCPRGSYGSKEAVRTWLDSRKEDADKD